MAEMMFYERPVALNRERHKHARIKPLTHASFAANIHSVPLTAMEFGPAAHDYMIVFAGDSAETARPVAMLGLAEGENRFVNAQGQWEPGTFIPGFIRRYPFVPAEKGDGDYDVFIDEAYAGLNDQEGEPLFNEDGSNTEALNHAIQVLHTYQQNAHATQDFMQRLRELELLEQRTLQDGDGQVVLQGFFVVNEEKLRSLDTQTAGELLSSGMLGWIYSHLLSLGNLDRLQMRTPAARPASNQQSTDTASAPAQSGSQSQTSANTTNKKADSGQAHSRKNKSSTGKKKQQRGKRSSKKR